MCSTLCFPSFLFIYRSSLSSNSPFRNWKILALCSLFFSAVSVTPMADTDIKIHGEQDPAIIIGRSVFTTRFILWRHGGGSHISKVMTYNVERKITITFYFSFCIANYVILTSSGFPKAAANVVHSLFRKSSGNLLAGKLVSKSMNGIFTSYCCRLMWERMTRYSPSSLWYTALSDWLKDRDACSPSSMIGQRAEFLSRLFYGWDLNQLNERL